VNNTAYQPHIVDIRFDKVTNRMHFVASVNNDNSKNPNNDVSQSSTHLVYAYSDDGGNTFHRADGAPIASLPMRADADPSQGDVVVADHHWIDIVTGVILLDGKTDGMDIVGPGLTIAAWIRASSFLPTWSDNRIISRSTGTGEQDHYWMLSTISSGGVKLRFRLKTNDVTNTLIAHSGNIATDTWIHVAATYDGSQMKLYKDGMVVGGMSKSGIGMLLTQYTNKRGIRRQRLAFGPSRSGRVWRGNMGRYRGQVHLHR
jgi:hypothetical protein